MSLTKDTRFKNVLADTFVAEAAKAFGACTYRKPWRLPLLRKVTLSQFLLLALTILLVGAICNGLGANEPASPERDRSPLSRSAVPRQQRDTRQQLVRVAADIQAGKASDAVAALRDLATTEPSSLVQLPDIQPQDSDGGRQWFADLPTAVRQLAMRIDPESRRRFEQQIDALAGTALRGAAQAGGMSRLRDVVRRFPQTPAGHRALAQLAAGLLDRGVWREAEVAFRRIAAHPLSNGDQIAVAVNRAELARRFRVADRPPSAIVSDRLFPDVETPAWQRAAAAGRSTIRQVQDALAAHSSQAIARLPRARPQIVGDMVFYREPNALNAVNLKSGQLVWSASESGEREPPSMVINAALQHLVSHSLAKQTQLDTVQSRFVIDDGLVFTAEWTRHGLGTQHREPGNGFGDDATSADRNGIVARQQSDGAVVWTLSAGDLPGQAADAFFPGPPTIVDDQAIGQVQIGTTLHLYTADRRSGTILWMLALADTDGVSVADTDRHATACPVIESQGMLVCPTAAGLIVGVDLLTRSTAWAIRIPRSDLPPEIHRLPAVTAPARRHWWAGWREVESVVAAEPDSAQETIVLAGPDSDALIAIDPVSGAIRWQQRVSNPLHLAGTNTAGAFICVERHAVAAIRPSDGKIVWRTPVPEPFGRGCRLELSRVADDDLPAGKSRTGTPARPEHLETGRNARPAEPHLILPVRGSRFAAVRLSDGNLTLSDAGLIDFAGSVAFAGDRFVTQQISGVSAWNAESAPSTNRPLVPVTRNGVETPLAVTHAAARKAAAAGEAIKAFQLYAEVLSQNPSSEVAAASIGPERRVRHDRLVQGEVLDLIAASPDDVRSRLLKQFQQMAQQSAESSDPFAVQRFVERWRGIPWVDSLAVRDEARIGFSFTRSQLELLRLAAVGNPADSAAAVERLAEMYESRRYTRDAEALRRAFGSTENLPASPSPWPDRQPTVSEQPERQADVGYRIVPVECQPGSLFQRLNVAVSDDTNAMRVRFFGDGNAGYWQISLGRGNGAFRGFPMLARGWGVGHLLVLRIGAELFGITPTDASGEPRARILWTRSLIGFQRLGSLQFDPSQPGFSINDLTFLDGFDRPIGRVGPVTPDVVCYQSGGRLICLDTATGRRMWERSELPRNHILAGDTNSIWLIDPGTGAVTVLRMLDGRQTGSFPLHDLTSFAGTVLKTRGNLVLLGERIGRGQSLTYRRVAAVDLSKRNVLWTSGANADAGRNDAFFAVGSDWLGRLSQDGTLRMLDVLTGRVVSEVTVARPAGLKTAFCATDAGSHVIALTETDELSFQQPRNVYRNPPLTGTLLAIDAHDGTLIWQRRFDGVRFALDQPKNLPALVLNYKKRRAGENTGFDTVLQILNRRTGADLRTRRSGANEERFFIEPNAPQSRASIRYSRRSIRLDYSSRK